jgi:hypothetical protein
MGKPGENGSGSVKPRARCNLEYRSLAPIWRCFRTMRDICAEPGPSRRKVHFACGILKLGLSE